MELTEYRGYTIDVDSRGVFAAGDLNADTMHELRDLIDDRLTALAKSRRMALPVLNEEAEVVNITGIHLGTARVTPKLTHAYANTPEVKALLEEKIRLGVRLNTIGRWLSQVAVPVVYGYSRVRAEEYGALIDRLVAAHRNAEERAKELTNE